MEISHGRQRGGSGNIKQQQGGGEGTEGQFWEVWDDSFGMGRRGRRFSASLGRITGGQRGKSGLDGKWKCHWEAEQDEKGAVWGQFGTILGWGEEGRASAHHCPFLVRITGGQRGKSRLDVKQEQETSLGSRAEL